MAKEAPKLPEIHFDTRTGNYWMRFETGRYLELSGRDCKQHFMECGFYIDPESDFGLKAGDAVLAKTRRQKFIDYAGPLAGHKMGLFETPGGKRILVTSYAAPVEAKKGKFPRIEKFISELLGGEQTVFALYWLKVAWEAACASRFRPGQLLALAGPGGCGKSFFQQLVTELLGGRFAKPYRYMTGKTQFNSDLAGAEHLVIEDENASLNLTARREFGTAIKNWTVDENISVHAKGREAVTLPFFRRVTLSVNDEPENLMILPPLDASLLGKITLFKCEFAKLDPNREKNMRMLREELPALAFELQQIKIPVRFRDDRFGVTHYHNPELFHILSELSPEYTLGTYIDQVFFGDKTVIEVSKTAQEIQRELLESKFGWEVQQILKFSSACGTYLARLALKNPQRYEIRKNKGRSIWLIKKGE